MKRRLHIYFWNPLDLRNWALGFDCFRAVGIVWFSIGPVTLSIYKTGR
jgi:hypothetical protein